MKKFVVTLSGLLFFLTSFCQDKMPVFVSETEGYKSFRMSGIIHLPNKNLLAFCEGRVHGAADFGNVDIVMKKSADNGKTWSALQVIVDADSLQAGNCAPIVDANDDAYPNGRIFLFYNTGNNNEGQVRKRNRLRQVWYKTSIDNAQT